MEKIMGIFGKIIFVLIGKIDWTPPSWIQTKDKKINYASISLISVFVVFSFLGLLVYNNYEKQIYLKAWITSPKITPAGSSPGELEIVFIEDNSIDKSPKSVADIDLAGKKFKKGIKLSPPIDGQWEWMDGKRLIFYPKKMWPAGTDIELHFDKKIFSKNIKLKEYKASLKTPELTALIDSLRFYTDPRDRTVHKAIAKIKFNYPVEAASLEKGISFTQEGKKIGYSLKFGKYKREVYLHSSKLNIEKDKKYLKLILNKGIRTIWGGSSSSKTDKKFLTIPGVDSFFKVESIKAKIVKNEEGEPEQTFILSFSDEVKRDALEKNVRAWVLPKQKNYKRWKSPAEITTSVLNKSKKIDLIFAKTKRDSSDTFGFVFDAPARRDIFIEIASGIKSGSGYELNSVFDDVIRVPGYPKELEIIGEGGILSISGNKKLSFKTRGIKAIKVKVSRLLDNQLQHLVTQARGGFNKSYFSNYYFNEENISQRFEKIIYLEPDHPKNAVYASLDLSKFLNSNGKKPGLFFIEARGYDPFRKIDLPVFDKRSVLLTDLLIVVKKNGDYSRDVFIHSISKNGPLKGVKVSVVGKNGLAVMEADTDVGGHVFFGSTNNFRNEKFPVAIVAKYKKDVSFIELNAHERRINFSGFDTGGVRSRYQNKKRVDSFLFTDRGIYRPGESFNIGVIVRHKGFNVPANIPVEYLVLDARGNTRLKKRIKVPKSGFFDISYKTETTDPTGRWSCQLYLVSKSGYRKSMIGNTSLEVETFQPDRLKIQSRLSKLKKGWIKGDDLKADIKLLNLFGAPAQDRKISAKLSLNPARFYFSEYKDFIFTDPFYEKKRPLKSINKTLKSKKTDVYGKTEFDLDLGSYEKGTYRLNLEINGYEKGEGRSVFAVNKALISPLDSLIGYKSVSNLSYLKKGSSHELDIIAVDQGLKKIEKRGLRLKKIKINTISALVKKNDGTYAYQSAKKEEDLEDRNFLISKSGERLKFDTKNPGDFALEIYDRETLLSRIEYSVAGISNMTASIDKRSELGLKINKKDIKAGEFLEAEITSPYKGSGLISIESDRLHTYRWFKTNGSKTIEKIRVPKNIEGNAYLFVSLVRSPDDASIFQSPLTYSVKPFYIDRSKRRLIPKINVVKSVKPGERLEIEYSTKRDCKIALFAADEGILQVANYSTPKPLSYFLKKKALEVETSQIADLILPEYRIIKQNLGIGGGFRADKVRMLAANLNPFQRKVNNPIVHWFGILDSGPEKKSVYWEVPDTFNGNLKIMAVAADSLGMGSLDKGVLVKGPFVITPAMPHAVSFNDKFVITLSVANLIEGSGKGLPVEVKIDAGKGVEVEGALTKEIKIDENGENVVEFVVRAKDTPGNVDFKFFAKSKYRSARTSSSISIRPPTPYRATIDCGIANSGKKEVKIKRRLIKELANQTINASMSPLILANGLEKWLDEFPHGCTEQLISKAFPSVVIKKGVQIDFDDESKIDKNIDGTIAKLRQRQTSNGGFCLWPGGKEHDFASLYSIHFLIEAQEDGRKVPQDLLRRSLSYLDDKASKSGLDLYSLRIRSYCVYLLTRLGKRTTNHLADIEDKLGDEKKRENDVISIFLAGSYKLLKKDYIAGKRIEDYRLDKKTESGSNWFTKSVTDPLYIYILGKHFSDELYKVTENDLKSLLEPVFKGDFNTLSSAMTILALGAWTDSPYMKAFSDSDITFKFRDISGENIDPKIERRSFPKAYLSTDIEKVDIIGNGGMFYLLSQNGYDYNLTDKDIRNGIEVIRKFETMDGKDIKELHPGEDFIVKLKIRSLSGKREDNIALIDLFTGGFYPDIESIRKNRRSQFIDYIDVREDRAVFYGSFGPEINEIRYSARASAKGEFMVPAVEAKSLYDPNLIARTKGGKIKVSKRNR